MQETFNISEVFRIAEQIERDGAAFYRKAAGKLGIPDVCELLTRLADWELVHERTFAQMRQDFELCSPAITLFDIEKCRAMACLSEFTIRPHDLAALTSTQSVIEAAIEMERDSLIFYTGLKDFVTEQAAADRIDQIIAEEHRHLAALREKL
ncbi:MAG: ferritin family protein [Phycisphaerae bacterium]|nr:ferritin family protein [Phycisphaerae bacterium]